MNINFTARVNSTSYGYIGLNLLKSLYDLGENVTYWPIDGVDRVQADPQYHSMIRECLSRERSYDKNAPSVRHCHQNDLAGHIGKGPHIGSTVFELDKFTKDEMAHLRNQDALITASKWGVEIFRANGLTQPAVAVPHGVDRSIFNEDVKPSIVFNTDPTVFINVSKKEIRKGHHELIDCFNMAFTEKDNVVLILAWTNRFYTKEENLEWDSYAKNSKLGSKIHIVDGFLDNQNQIASLYSSADCGVSFSRSEGFGLFPLEMMSLGKQIIISNCTGHTEYANENNSLLIEMGPPENAYDGKWFFSQGSWSSITNVQIEQMINHMRYIHDLKTGLPTLSLNIDGINTAKNFSWESAGIKLTNFIKTLV